MEGAAAVIPPAKRLRFSFEFTVQVAESQLSERVQAFSFVVRMENRTGEFLFVPRVQGAGGIRFVKAVLYWGVLSQSIGICVFVQMICVFPLEINLSEFRFEKLSDPLRKTPLRPRPPMQKA